MIDPICACFKAQPQNPAGFDPKPKDIGQLGFKNKPHDPDRRTRSFGKKLIFSEWLSKEIVSGIMWHHVASINSFSVTNKTHFFYINPCSSTKGISRQEPFCAKWRIRIQANSVTNSPSGKWRSPHLQGPPGVWSCFCARHNASSAIQHVLLPDLNCPCNSAHWRGSHWATITPAITNSCTWRVAKRPFCLMWGLRRPPFLKSLWR